MNNNNNPDSLNNLSQSNINPTLLSNRLVNLLIDTSIMAFAQAVIGGMLNIPRIEIFNNATQKIILPTNNELFINVIFSLSITILYYFPMEFSKNKSIGKLLTKTCVISADGTKPTAMQILIRCLCRSIPFNIISILFRKGISWHDSIANTRVISKVDYDKIFQN